ncbi:MAG: hypothetical protein HRT44_00945 [Bdellovibrionales bacterium]|nr:hypothetical protein [Bdellovibrionales bacterium]NQZ17817.1 hypothetical protein [Bdellovibrionales bacterium]
MISNSSPWILNHKTKDIIFLISPAFITILLGLTFFSSSDISIIVLFFVFGLIDNGHVYLTFFRTHINSNERKSSSLFWQVPLGVFIFFFIWLFAKAPYLWHFVVYVTLFHNVRQFYGITRWYQKNIKDPSPWPGRFLYLLTVIPIVAYHFRSDILTGIYSAEDIFYYPSDYLFSLSMGLYFIVLSCWAAFEILNRKKSSLGRVLSIVTPLSAYSFGLLFGKTLFQVLGPIVIAHGVGYMALMAHSLEKTEPNVYKKFYRTLVMFIGVLIIAGAFEAYLSNYLDQWMKDSGEFATNNIFLLALMAFYLTPLFCHYVYDAYLWRKGHREAHLIYQ